MTELLALAPAWQIHQELAALTSTASAPGDK